MRILTLTQAAKVIGQLAVYFPRADFGEVTVLKWAEELVAYDVRDAEVAVKSLARRNVHPPALSEILAACVEASMQRAELERLSRPRLPEPAIETDPRKRAAAVRRGIRMARAMLSGKSMEDA